jgi:hypothetical protein
METDNSKKDTTQRKDIFIEIQTIFDDNRINDLNRFLRKRQCLNTANSYFVYLFHLVQSAGILTTSIAAGTNNTELVWVGIGLNIFATLINIYEKTNNSISAKLLNDIKLIKSNHYVDEGFIVETDANNDKNTNSNTNSNKNSTTTNSFTNSSSNA